MKKTIASVCPLLLICLMLASTARAASTREDLQVRIDQAKLVLDHIMSAQDATVPLNILQQATCVAVVPGMLKGAFVVGAQGEPALRALAGPRPNLGGLDAMVAGVAHQVHERVFDGFDDRAVEFRFSAFHLQVKLLAQGDGHIAHHARQFVPHRADGLHARLHHAFLQFGGNQVQPLRGGVQSRIFPVGVELQNLVAG